MKNYYREKRTFLPWSDGKIIGYLNEEIVKDYTPSDSQSETTDTFDAFSYEGTERDGGTILDCQDVSNRDELANAIIRAKYNSSAEAAIKRHHMLLQDDSTIAKADEYKAEWEAFNAWCDYAISTADSWLI